MKLFLRSFTIFLLTLTLLTGMQTRSALAGSDPSTDGAVGHDQAVKSAPGKFVQAIGDTAIRLMADKKIAQKDRIDQFRQILRDSFDLMTVGRFVIGRSWNNASPEEQKEYMKLFEELVIKNYGDRMNIYTGEGFEVTGSRAESEKDTIVTSHITHPDGSQPTEIDWRLRMRNGKYGIIDVVVEGVSLSVTQRQEYAAVIQKNGGQIAPLLDLMRKEIAEPSSLETHD